MESPAGSRRSLTALLGAQTLLSFSSNAGKMLVFALLLAPGVLAEKHVDPVLSLLPAILALPYLICSPLAAWGAEKFSSRTVMNAALAVHVVFLGGLALAFQQRNLVAVLAALALLALHSAVVSPAKRALLRDVVPARKLNASIALLEMLTITAIVVGAFAGVAFFEGWLAVDAGTPWTAARRVAYTLVGGSVVAWLVFQLTNRPPTAPVAADAGVPLGQQVNHLVELLRSPRLRNTALGICFYYVFGGVLVLVLIGEGRAWVAANPGGLGVSMLAVTLLLCTGLGALAGSLVGGLIARDRMEVGSVPYGAAGMALGAWWASHCEVGSPGMGLALLWLGYSSGFYLAPEYVYFQNRVSGARRLRMLGALNVFRGLGGVIAGGLYYVMAVVLAWPPAAQLAVLAWLAAVAAVVALWTAPEHLFLLTFRALGCVLYRLRLHGAENLPRGGALVISNHISYVDALILQAVFPRKLWFLALHGPQRRGLLRWFYRITGVIPLSSERATSGLRLAIRKMKEGELVCVFPEGQVTRTGALMEIRRGFETLARRADVPVVPVFIDSLWGSIYSYSNQKLIWKLPERVPHAVLVQIGAPLPNATITAPLARQALLDLGEVAYQQRAELRSHLGREVVRSLARHPWKTVFVDRTADRRELSAGMLLAAAAAYAAKLRRELPDRRIGIVLPPGAGGAIANLAVMLANRVPVNLNFTAGKTSLESCMRMGGVTTVLSAAAVRAKLPNFPWPERTRDVKDDLAAVGKPAVLARLLLVWLLPSRWLNRLWGVPAVGDRDEALLLFTSGSSGEPKGVALSHRNVLGNVGQINATGILPKQETLLACLPIFHSFGATVLLWYPMLRVMRTVTLPTPLDAKKVIDVIEEEGVTIHVGTPTFIRPVLKKAEPPQLTRLRFMLSGAEKLPVDLYEFALQRFGVPIYQGYGLTETTPVANVNVPDPRVLPPGVKPQQGHRLGSIGRLLAGMTARIVHPETGEILPPNQTGMLWLKGPNVFSGYLDDPKRTAEALRDGWFVTGDLARFDEDGFCYIEGRLSRFSKIGGEMVPHLTVEQKIVEALGLDPAEAQQVVVLGVPDAAKGESLVVLSTVEVDLPALREKLAAAGLPNLWIPKTARRIEKIPVLGTGKTDLKGCKELAVQLAAKES